MLWKVCILSTSLFFVVKSKHIPEIPCWWLLPWITSLFLSSNICYWGLVGFFAVPLFCTSFAVQNKFFRNANIVTHRQTKSRRNRRKKNMMFLFVCFLIQRFVTCFLLSFLLFIRCFSRVIFLMLFIFSLYPVKDILAGMIQPACFPLHVHQFF